jgi:amino acid adenylation domain-containing protein
MKSLLQDSADRPLDYGGPVDRPYELFPESALDKSIVDRFETIARRFAARTAVADTARLITYAELAQLVVRIAAATVKVADGRPGPIAILLPRDVTFPAAMLAVLTSGRGFVPLDASDPVERTKLVATRAGAVAVISAGADAALWGRRFGHYLPVVDIGAVEHTEPSEPAARPAPGDLACILYTSGSTGTPKGVHHDHRNVLHTVMQRTNAYQLTPEDHVGLLDSPTSIAGLRDIFLALLNGAALHVLTLDQLGPAGLAREIRARGISVFRTAPVLLRRLADALDPDQRFDALRIVVTGGQRVDWVDFDVFKRVSPPGAYLHVGSGLTETAGQFSGWFVDEKLRTPNAVLPVGRLHPDLSLTMVDENGDVVPEGEIGEFVVSGRYLAQGYWNDPELTAQMFTTDPDDPEIRTFRTGDWGRRREDGLIEFVGRKDQQIKLNGRRIEIGEIEAALRACADVQDAAVIVRRDRDGLPSLLKAYAEPKRGADPSARELTAALKAVLPEFMVPGQLTVLDQLPRLPSLKIDLEELRRRDKQELEQSQSVSRVEVRTKMEEILLNLWREVLDRGDVGYDDDFFQSGGNSIAAVDLVLRIEKQLQYRLPLTLLAEAPTVRELYGRLEANTLGAIDNMVRVHTGGSRTPLFAVPGGGGHALGLVPLFRSFGADQPCYGLQPPEMDWTRAGYHSLTEIAAHYIREIKAVQSEGPYRLLGDSFGGLVVFEMALQLQHEGERVEFLAMLDTFPPTVVREGEIDRSLYGEEINDLAPPPGGVRPESILELNDWISHTHSRFGRDYVLDERSAQQVFRGELTYFVSVGTPVVARNDRRRLWQSFATTVRLLPMPGSHGTPHREPQYSFLANVLKKCLDRQPVPVSDFASVFGRDYELDDSGQPGQIIGTAGEVFVIDPARSRGFVNEVRVDDGKMRLTGWALESGGSQPAQTIAVFLDGVFVGYGACGEPRPEVTAHFGEHTRLFSGFVFSFDDPSIRKGGRPRLFVLAKDGRAYELAGIEPMVIGAASELSSIGNSRVVLSGDWAPVEPWGVWSDGARATVGFDASRLPDRFRLEIEVKLFPEQYQAAQSVSVLSSGALLATITNGESVKTITVDLRRPLTHATTLMSLDFAISNPVSPLDLGLSNDPRKLGLGLVSLVFKRRPWWKALFALMQA